MNQRATLLAFVAAVNAAACAGIFHRINAEATARYKEITHRADYQLALQKTFEFAVSRPEGVVAAMLPPPPKPAKVYLDVPPLALARSYVETDPSRYAKHIQRASRATNVPVALIRAVISAESAFNPYALSATGAVGLMQLMPDTAARYGVKNRMDPSQNILGGARYLSDLLRMFNNNMRLTIAAYNAGEGAVMKYGRKIPPFPETVAYVPKVLMYYKRYRLA